MEGVTEKIVQKQRVFLFPSCELQERLCWMDKLSPSSLNRNRHPRHLQFRLGPRGHNCAHGVMRLCRGTWQCSKPTAEGIVHVFKCSSFGMKGLSTGYIPLSGHTADSRVYTPGFSVPSTPIKLYSQLPWQRGSHGCHRAAFASLILCLALAHVRTTGAAQRKQRPTDFIRSWGYLGHQKRLYGLHYWSQSRIIIKRREFTMSVSGSYLVI